LKRTGAEDVASTGETKSDYATTAHEPRKL
jgi:hypothetical protein